MTFKKKFPSTFKGKVWGQERRICSLILGVKGLKHTVILLTISEWPLQLIKFIDHFDIVSLAIRFVISKGNGDGEGYIPLSL